MNRAIIIPSLNPGKELPALVEELTRVEAGAVIVVNDGSGDQHSHIFAQVTEEYGATLLSHDKNLGKGAALKTAFAYCKKNLPDLMGVVTADDDGQHTPEDILKVSEALCNNPECLVLGSRDFTRSETPKRSYLGNRLTSRVFNFFYKVRLPDTQTGLRGIPAPELDWLKDLGGNRYEYEINMLIQAKRRKIGLVQVPIKMLYFDGNRGSHFKTVRDTLRITGTLIKGLGSLREKSFYGLTFRISRFMVRRFTKKLESPCLAPDGPVPRGPSVIVSHHQNLKGALNAMAWLKIPVRLWMLDTFFNRKECFRQYYGYTFTGRMNMPKPFAFICSFVSSLFIPRLAVSMRAIPVCRNSTNIIKTTMKQSVNALLNGERLLIFPDQNYADESEQIGSVYTGFVHIGKKYRERTGSHIDFIPMKLDLAAGRIAFGRPSRLTDGEVYANARERVCRELTDKINSL